MKTSFLAILGVALGAACGTQDDARMTQVPPVPTPDMAQNAQDPLNAAPGCQSGVTWDYGDSGNDFMHPGLACIDCHSTRRGAPRFYLAGTVYGFGHEDDDCDGDSTGAKVVITDANGVVTTLRANHAGNFYARKSITMPYTAKVVTADGKERAMTDPQTTGDCNSCHTQSGDNKAPGRITLPF